MVLPHGQRENYFTLLFLFKILICPVSDRLATGVSYYWTNLPSTSKYPAAYVGFFFFLFWRRQSADLKVTRVHRVLLLNIKFLFVLLLLPSSVVPSQTGRSLAQEQLLNSVAQLPAEEPQWCSHHSWLVLQLASTHTMPYLGKDKVRNKLKRICSRPLKMLPMEA